MGRLSKFLATLLVIVVVACAPTGGPQPGGSGAVGQGAPAGAPPSKAAAEAPKPLAKVVAAWVAITANQMVVPVAYEAGYFQKHGIDLDLRFIQGSSTATQAQVAGDVDITIISGHGVVTSHTQGADTLFVAGFLNTPVFRIMAAPGVSRVEDVKGKAIAVSRVGNADYFTWLAILERFRLIPEVDVNFVSADSQPGQIALLKRGEAAATALSPPNNVAAEKEGAHEIMDTASLGLPEQNNGLVVRKSWLQTHRDLMLNFVKASIEGIHRIKNDKAFFIEVERRYLKLEDPEVLEAGYNAYVNVFPEKPYPTLEGMRRIIKDVSTQNPAAASVKAEDLIDDSLVRELDNSGFIRQIYSR